MSGMRAGWSLGMVVALVASMGGHAAPVEAAAPAMGHMRASAPKVVNVRDLARAAAQPGHIVPVRRSVPALAGPKASARPRIATSAAPAPMSAGPRPLVAASGPGFREKVAFAGLADAAVPSSTPLMEPPDPWVAAGPNHVVQAVNATIRFSARDGTFAFEESLAEFFREPSAERGDGDARVLYDPIHGRWVASELSYDCAAGHVQLAVSNTGDPTATWTVWDVAFAGSLPDYPGLGLSSDKIVFTANHFPIDAGTCLVGADPTAASIYTLDWAAALAGGSPPISYWTPAAGDFTWRAAANLTADATVHLVAEGPAYQVLYGEITGTDAGANLTFAATDLTGAGIVSAFATPPSPQDPVGALPPYAVDSRPTDALWQAGHLWFVSTYPATYDAGATYRDSVRVTELDTTGGVSRVQDLLLGDAGFDAYSGGIGLSQAGGLYAVYTESNGSNYRSLLSAFQGPASPRGQMDGYRTLAAGEAGYRGIRWGDYVGVATDPVDPYAVWQAGEYANAAGSWSTRVSMLTVATVPSAPSGVTAVPGDASAQVSWSAPADDGGAAVTGYAVIASPDGATCTTTGALSCTVAGLANGTAYTFTVTGTNQVGDGPASAPSVPVTPIRLPVASIRTLPAWLASTSIALRWSAVPGTAAVAGYDVRYRRAAWNGGFGSYVTWRTATTATGATFSGYQGSTYCFSARARDALGGLSAWTADTCTAVPLDDRSLVRYGSWSAGTGSAYYRSTYVRSYAHDARLVRKGAVARRIAIVATTCPTCGSVRVYWGSTLLRTISLRSTTTVNRRLIAVTTFTAARSGTLTIKVYSSARKVLIDGVALRLD